MGAMRELCHDEVWVVFCEFDDGTVLDTCHTRDEAVLDAHIQDLEKNGNKYWIEVAEVGGPIA